MPSHGLAVDRIDRDCSLLAAVRRLLPASAIATHSGTCAHVNGRLFLAVSKQRDVRDGRRRLRHSPTLKAPGR